MKKKPRETLTALRMRAKAGTLSSTQLRRLTRDPRAGVRALVAALKKRQKNARAEANRLGGMLEHEHEHWRRGRTQVAGVDEAGAGPLAGPVIAAAVILPAGESIAGIDDSKRLTARQREHLALEIEQRATTLALGSCSVEEIDALNILQASRLAMQRAVEGLETQPQHLLVDARKVPGVSMTQTSLVHGDQRSQSIAAASILAKVHRDALMADLALAYPGYGFERHRGYGTRAHMSALKKLGPCPIHRLSFRPVAIAAGLVVPKKKRRRRRKGSRLAGGPMSSGAGDRLDHT